MPDKDYLKELSDSPSGLAGIQGREYVTVATKRQVISHIETFFNFQDASLWIEKHLEEYNKDEWFLEQCSINLINGAYRSGVFFSKVQKDLFVE